MIKVSLELVAENNTVYSIQKEGKEDEEELIIRELLIKLSGVSSGLLYSITELPIDAFFYSAFTNTSFSLTEKYKFINNLRIKILRDILEEANRLDNGVRRLGIKVKKIENEKIELFNLN
jgi:hypothetical protein